jgi:hypothetical protein
MSAIEILGRIDAHSAVTQIALEDLDDAPWCEVVRSLQVGFLLGCVCEAEGFP